MWMETYYNDVFKGAGRICRFLCIVSTSREIVEELTLYRLTKRFPDAGNDAEARRMRCAQIEYLTRTAGRDGYVEMERRSDTCKFLLFGTFRN